LLNGKINHDIQRNYRGSDQAFAGSCAWREDHPVRLPCAGGDARKDSDLDILVAGPVVKARREEMVRLSDVLRPLRVPVDIIVASRKNFEEWADVPGTIFNEAAKRGRLLYDGQAAG
jgi:predicted nucleotidyltransferase